MIRLLVQFARCNEVALIDRQTHEAGIVRRATDQSRVQLVPIAILDVAFHFADAKCARQRGERVDKYFEVGPFETVLEKETGIGDRLASRFNAADDNVRCAEVLYLLLRLVADADADGQQPNHTRHPNEKCPAR